LIENLAYETYKLFFWIPWLKIEAFFWGKFVGMLWFWSLKHDS
jgi:hypothetical protein